MSFKKMSISNKIIAGYVMFFVILVFICGFVTVQNTLSLGNANTLSLNEECNMNIQEALNDFLNGRVGARILMLSDNYTDETYNSTAANLDGCLEHLRSALNLSEKNDMAQIIQLLNTAITNTEKYKTKLADLHNLQREKAVIKDSFSTLGKEAVDALNAAVNSENEAIRTAISSGGANVSGYDSFYEFADIRTQLYNASMLGAKLAYLSDASSYEAIITAIEAVKTSLNDYSETIPASRRGAADGAINAMNVYGAAFVTNLDIVEQITEATNNLIATNELVQASLNEASNSASSELSDMVEKILSGATASLWLVIIMFAIAGVLNGILSFEIVTSIKKALGNAMRKLDETTVSVVSASGELLSAAGSIAQGGSEQAAAIEETSATMNETASMVQQNTENTREAASLSNETVNAAMKGVKEMKTLIEFMDKLSKSSGEIGKIVDSINIIAFQTNILALNASVEAARAGEAGKSFAVVAEEVRSLSQNSADAADNTSAIIGENIELSNQSVQNSKSVGETLSSISDSIQKVNNLINEISSASEEQSRGVQQINIALSQMEKVTQSNAAISQQSAAAANELMTQACRLEAISEEIRILAGN